MNRETAKEFLDDRVINLERLLSVLIESGKTYRFTLPYGHTTDSSTIRQGKVVVITNTQVTYSTDFNKEFTLQLRDILALEEVMTEL